MISCDKGKVTLSGTAIELTADVIAINEAFLRTLDNKTDDLRYLNDKLVKNIIYSFVRSADRLGYSTQITDDELNTLEKAWKGTFEK